MNKLNHKLTLIIGMLVMIAISVGALHFSRVLYVNDPAKEDIKKAEKIKNVVEGDIIDRADEVILNPTEPLPENSTKVDLAYSYIVGYNHISLGSSGLRKAYSEHLFNDDETGKGGTIQLTIDHMLQKSAYQLLKGEDMAGSIIVMDVKTGELLAMASRRSEDLDLNELDNDKFDEYSNWTDVKGRKNLFVDPAREEQEAPGSVYKVVTACAAIENGLGDYKYTDTGETVIDKATIKNAKNGVYYDETLESALINSTNTYFANLSVKLKERNMKEMAEKFLVGSQVDVGFSVLPSVIEFNGRDANLAMIGFGQGSLALTPLHIALIGQSISNDGEMIKPVLVKKLYDAKGRNIFEDNGGKLLAKTVKKSTAKKIKELMQSVTESNFPEFLNYNSKVYSKTGTAEIEYGGGKIIHHTYLLSMTDDYVVLVSVNDTYGYGSDLKGYVEKMLSLLYDK